MILKNILNNLIAINLNKYFFFIYHIFYIVGSFLANSLSVFFILSNLKYFKKSFFNNFNKKYLIFGIIFFLFLLLNVINSTHPEISLIRFISILKFFIFGYILYSFFIDGNFENKFLNFSKFTFFIVSFVGFDLIFQFYFGKNIFLFSMENISQFRFSGVFRDELIVGSYLSYFFLYGSFYLEKHKPILLAPYFFFCVFSIAASGEKKALIMSIFVLVIYYMLKLKNLKKIFLFLIILLSLLTSIFFTNDKIFSRFFDSGGSIIKELGFSTKNDGSFGSFFDIPHVKHFRSALIIWEENKIIGSGLKTFRYNCHNEKSVKILKQYYCSTHPHNIYFEFISELGLIGLFFLLTFIFLLSLNVYSNFKKFRNNPSISILLCLGILMVLYPFQTTGSFFSSKNLYLNSLVFSLFMGYVRYLNTNKKQK